MTGRAAELSVVSALAVVLAVAMAAPVLRAPSERLFGRELVGRHHDPFTVMRQIDRPIAIGPYFQPFTDIPGALLARLAGPVAAYNWLVLLTFPLAALAAYLLGRHLGLGAPGATLGALTFAFSPFHIAQAAYHPHIAQTQWIPFYLFALWRCLDRTTPGALALLAASTAGVVLSNFYGGLIAAVLTPVAVAAHWLFRPRRERRAPGSLAATNAALGMMAAAGVAYVWYVASPVANNPAAYGFARAELFLYSAKWWSYLVPPVTSPILGRVAEGVWDRAGVHEGLLEQQVTLGWGVVVLAMVALWAWIGRRGSAAPRAAPLLATVAAAGLVCSLSPERDLGPFTFTRPSALLYEVVPMFRSYARFGVVVQLMAALLAGLGAETLWRATTRSGRIACLALVALVACEYAVWPPALWRDVLPTRAHRWVTHQPGRVRAVDCTPPTAEPDAIEWLSRGTIVLRPAGFEDCTEPRLADKLAAGGYTHLLVRANAANASRLAHESLPEGMQLGARFPDGAVLTITTAPPVAHTSLMTAFYPREYDGVWTWRWMAPGASWQVVNNTRSRVTVTGSVEMAAFNRRRTLTVRLDGREVQTLSVGDAREVARIGPLTLSPGVHDLAFQPVEPPTVANDLLKNGDPRALSVRIGSWRWSVGAAP